MRFLLYVVGIIDRVNFGFAKLQMQQALRFSDVVYGLGAGIFFVGYFLFEIRSNIVLARVGARKWIARIPIMWGPIAAATAFVQTPLQFYILRFLLGVGEAGLFPGIVLFLTYWFPAERRCRYIALFMLGIPIAGMQGLWGLQGWQWMFIVQVLTALFLGLIVLVWLDDRPARARRLTDAEKSQLQAAVGEPAEHLRPMAEIKLALAQKGIGLETMAYFFLVAAASAFGLWGPQFLQDILKTDLKGIGAALALIFAIDTVLMIVVGFLADCGGRRETILLTVLTVLTLSALGFATTGLMTANPGLVVAGFVVGVGGYLAALPVFWGSLTPRLVVAAAPAAIALVNSIGNVGGAIGPALLGPIKQNLSLAPSILALAAMMALAALFALSFRKSSPC